MWGGRGEVGQALDRGPQERNIASVCAQVRAGGEGTTWARAGYIHDLPLPAPLLPSPCRGMQVCSAVRKYNVIEEREQREGGTYLIDIFELWLAHCQAHRQGRRGGGIDFSGAGAPL